MALRLSTGARNKVLGGVPERHVAQMAGTGIAAVDNGGSDDYFTTSDGTFSTSGISVGDAIIAYGFTGGMAGVVGPFTVTSVAAGTMGVPTGSLANNAAGESVTLKVITGGSIRDVFKQGVLKIYSGSQPATADAAVTGTLLLTITVGAQPFTAGNCTNGLEFGAAANGMVSKGTSYWQGTAVASAEAGWFRLSANGTDGTGVSTTLPRIDGAITETGGGGEIEMSDTTVTSGNVTTIDTFTISLPSS